MPATLELQPKSCNLRSVAAKITRRQPPSVRRGGFVLQASCCCSASLLRPPMTIGAADSLAYAISNSLAVGMIAFPLTRRVGSDHASRLR